MTINEEPYLSKNQADEVYNMIQHELRVFLGTRLGGYSQDVKQDKDTTTTDTATQPTGTMDFSSLILQLGEVLEGLDSLRNTVTNISERLRLNSIYNEGGDPGLAVAENSDYVEYGKFTWKFVCKHDRNPVLLTVYPPTNTPICAQCGLDYQIVLIQRKGPTG